MSIHILGLGNLGKLLAHSLRKSHPEIPITLLFHRPSLAEDWERAGRCIEIVRNGQPDRQGGFLWEGVWKEKGQIQNLILATKTYSTVQALRPLKDRLGSESTVLFLQNGIGMHVFHQRRTIWFGANLTNILSRHNRRSHVPSLPSNILPTQLSCGHHQSRHLYNLTILFRPCRDS